MAGWTSRALGRVIRSVGIADRAGASDGELLRCYADRGDQAAFAALFERHAGMVLAVCRRSLTSLQDAEDACQATFLILASKANDGQWGSSIANWLHTTARQVARNARVAADRRPRHEGSAAVPTPAADPLSLALAAGSYFAANLAKKSADDVIDKAYTKLKDYLLGKLGPQPKVEELAPDALRQAGLAADPTVIAFGDEVLARSPALRRAVLVAKVIQGARVLWVDDEPGNNLNECRILTALGATLRQIETTREALAALTGTSGTCCFRTWRGPACWTTG